MRDRVGSRPRDRVVELRSQQCAPGCFENRPAVAHTSGSVRVARQRDQRLGDPLEPELHQPVTALQGRTRAVYSLQRPRVAV